MSVYKEGYYIIGEIQKKSLQIYSDACDYGAPVKQGDPLWNLMKQLTEWYGVKGSRQESRYKTGRSVQQKIELMDEWAVSDGYKSEKEATEIYRLSFVSCTEGKCKGFDGYLSIEKISPKPASRVQPGVIFISRN